MWTSESDCRNERCWIDAVKEHSRQANWGCSRACWQYPGAVAAGGSWGGDGGTNDGGGERAGGYTCDGFGGGLSGGLSGGVSGGLSGGWEQIGRIKSEYPANRKFLPVVQHGEIE